MIAEPPPLFTVTAVAEYEGTPPVFYVTSTAETTSTPETTSVPEATSTPETTSLPVTTSSPGTTQAPSGALGDRTIAPSGKVGTEAILKSMLNAYYTAGRLKTLRNPRRFLCPTLIFTRSSCNPVSKPGKWWKDPALPGMLTYYWRGTWRTS